MVTGVGLGALYFLAASGLSLIYGLMGVLNFAHGAFMMAGAYAGWLTMRGLPASLSVGTRLAVAMAAAVVVGALIGLVVEVVLIRPLYRHHIQQVLVTVGLSLAAVAAVQGIWGADAAPAGEACVAGRNHGGRSVPTCRNDRFLFIAAAGLLFAGLLALLRFTRLGPGHPGGRGEPHHGRGARHQRAAHLLRRLRHRRCRGRPGRAARRRLRRQRLARPGRRRC